MVDAAFTIPRKRRCLSLKVIDGDRDAAAEVAFDIAFDAQFTAESDDQFTIGIESGVGFQVGVHPFHHQRAAPAALDFESLRKIDADVAAGLSANLEIAQALTKLTTPLPRSVVIAFWDGEEKGLLGADYYAKNPTVPKSSIVANINMDMPVVLTELLDVVTIGVDHSSLQKQVEQAATEIGFLLSPDPAPDEVVFVRSDQFAFVRQGIPAVYLDGGVIAKDPNIIGKDLLENFLKTHYHKPSDDLKQPIHYVTAAKMAALNARIGQLVADDPYRPRWNLGDFLGQKFAGQP